ncbi:PAS domain-containing sensor histidine kinase [Mucilaginibacter myungsuensis]|uniref:histidine kinase n=1 Tax=Mucilaginibacter myungsuensis TaxID=649104 RepID=A0A929L0R6_9SPHI|nr:ATP-binding protein [Mucilaginibacter myungsuensis]MBE9664120.1 PAS domain-containing protein [Mucilaginibacter myungsuensis]MDN3601299.1 ATP-binding protein [Mucilaginibacter myungsuensis]
MADTSLTNGDRKLSESEERYRALVTATSEVVYRMSPDWSVMHELDGGSFLPDTGEPIADWMQKYVHPVDQELVVETISDAVRYKKMFRLEHRVLQADGSLGWTSSTAIPVLDDAGDIIEWFGAASDISARKNTEEALRISKEQAEQQKRLMEIVTSNTPDLVYIFALDYTFTFANPALLTMWGKTWDNAVGKRLLDNGYEPWHAEMHEREIDHVAATKETVRGEVAFPHAELGRRVYDYILTPVINALGEVEAVAGTTRDISEIKENEQRKNDFISMVSHELKTPLTSVISYVQIAQKRAAQNNDELAGNMLARAGKQLAKMTRMINGFLNVSRLESGRIHIDLEPFDLSLLIKEVEEETAATINSHHINFDHNGETWVNADREKIEQVFNNLISNAIKYSHADTAIEVSYHVTGDHVQVSVTDEGIGIDPNDLPRLFERYYRVKEAELNHIAGFGIGLYLCAEIIKRHGGEIWAESSAEKGSVFNFTLPLYQK